MTPTPDDALTDDEITRQLDIVHGGRAVGDEDERIWRALGIETIAATEW